VVQERQAQEREARRLVPPRSSPDWTGNRQTPAALRLLSAPRVYEYVWRPTCFRCEGRCRRRQQEM
jgi:hypothetical protein